MEDLSLPRFLARYFPTFMGGIFAALLSLGCAIPLVTTSYFAGASIDEQATWSVLGGAAVTLVVVHCNFMMVRGWPLWVWGVVAVLVLCLLVVLPTIGSHPHKVIYVLAVMFPLLGLLVLNSKRHREMRSRLVEIRHQREMLRQELKGQRKK
ncbi:MULTISPECIES: hypothetical protein [unclassified Pseudomonas]|uniref:hypothetical protein n=1 Tax=unclassified Pseudomonas TaxID=196821 RepID=UPI0008712EFF|nr:MULTISPECIES: hypothetical protein [unclassified Pseudomonas]SCW86300.1 hypothetical protein SAMN03159424_03770 [Pseudomonas sp. NFACC05-1]SCZ37191.1 hypothetical protein SAMN03159405_03694 [Pseudomonas sp. NFACC44-2]SDA69571.1 hypothetical protein SAMN03159429_02925 [Pseudomonas sp. NFACC51]SDW86965.1 hypothetical protein SAMN03159474_01809 [Pseudomonas sp. NFACC08-1]SEJ52681.1 hypothetical protein SAMN03159298_03455 [Pseudomonas sp. NFACC07-1]